MSEEENQINPCVPTSNIETEVNTVSIKIPPFWAEKPEILFNQVEAQHSISNIISEKTKFNYLDGQLNLTHSKHMDIFTSSETNH